MGGPPASITLAAPSTDLAPCDDPETTAPSTAAASAAPLPRSSSTRGAVGFACLLVPCLIVLAMLIGSLDQRAARAPLTSIPAAPLTPTAPPMPNATGPLVDAAADGQPELQDAALLASLSALAYASDPLNFRYEGAGFHAGSRLHLSTRGRCVAFDVVECYDALSYELSAPTYVQAMFSLGSARLHGPHFCIRNASGFGLVVSWRGTYSADDAVTDLAGLQYLRSVNAAPLNASNASNAANASFGGGGGGVASVHGATLDAYEAQARALLHDHLRDPRFAHLPLYLSGHSLGVRGSP